MKLANHVGLRYSGITIRGVYGIFAKRSGLFGVIVGKRLSLIQYRTSFNSHYGEFLVSCCRSPSDRGPTN